MLVMINGFIILEKGSFPERENRLIHFFRLILNKETQTNCLIQIIFNNS